MTTNNVPEPVAVLAAQMASFPDPWALCGGWAVDAWLGRESREHGDIDLSVFVQDQRALYEHLRGWQLLAHDSDWQPGNDNEWWDGRRRLNHPAHIHGRPAELSGAMPEDGIATAEDGFSLDIQLDDRQDEDWVLSHDPLLSVPLARCIAESAWGLPTVVPEVLLFYKARDLRRRDKLDFLVLLPALSNEQREWLHDAIALIGHPWAGQLSGERLS